MEIKKQTDCTELSIITKFVADDTNYTVFTTLNSDANNKFQSIIKLTNYNRTIWSRNANSIKEALINHVALTEMASRHVFINWSDKIFQLYKPEQAVGDLISKKVYPKQNSFISTFTKKLFNSFCMNANFSGLVVLKYLNLLALSALVILIFFNSNLI